ncbi:rhs-family protein [Erwinia amylovora Ea266]|nr:rhs-family protein [Erwinia amylovora Ea266]
MLRQKLAIRHDWGVVITKVSEFKVPQGTWISEGPAAAQGAGYPGLGYQAVVSNLPKSWIINTLKVPW